MRTMLVLTFVVDDRTGVVEKLSRAVAEQGGNWLESRMAHLAEKFAGIARIELPSERTSSLRRVLKTLEAEGFHFTVEETALGQQSTGKLLTLDLVGPDQTGIVRDITRCLAERGVSVEDMQTDVREAPMGGGAHFYAKARVRAPVDLNEDELRESLEALSAALMVDITLRHDS